MGSDANDLDTAGLLEQPLSADAAASPQSDRLLGSEPSEDNEEEEPRAGRADAGQAPTRATGPDAGPGADASLTGERGLVDSSLLDVLLGGAEEEEEDMLSPSPAASRRRPLPPDDRRLSSPSDRAATLPTARVQWSICAHTRSTLIHLTGCSPARTECSSAATAAGQRRSDGSDVTRPATGTARQHGGTVTDAPVGWCGAVSVGERRERE